MKDILDIIGLLIIALAVRLIQPKTLREFYTKMYKYIQTVDA